MTDFPTKTPTPTPSLDQAPTRPVTQSVTFGGLAILAAPLVAQAFGLEPDQFANGLDALIQLAGLGLAIFGRFRVGDLHWPWQRA